MTSVAYGRWRAVGLVRLDELEQVHAAATAGRRGRVWGTDQLNRGLFVALVAQFQDYCRALHDGAVDVHVAAANPQQATVLQALLTQGRKIDTQNPRVAHLGSDFGRLGFSLIDDLKAAGPDLAGWLRRLDLLIDFRNAVGHGDDTKIKGLIATGEIRPTKVSYRQYRGTLDRLAGTMDAVVATALATRLKIPPPW